jgi:AcrR family transcriptional regulator
LSRVILVPTRSAADARGRVLQSARRRFATDGALAATLDEIRRDAEVSVGALYHHFPDKSALAAAVYAQVMTEYQAGFVTMLRRHDTAEGGIRGGVAHHLRWVTDHRGEAALLLGDRLDSPALDDSNRAFFADIRDWWRPHHGYGALRPMQGAVTAALWFGPAQEFSRYWIAGDEPRMPRGVVKTFADAAWKALRANAIEEDS